jgi:hypothetical protein
MLIYVLSHMKSLNWTTKKTRTHVIVVLRVPFTIHDTWLARTNVTWLTAHSGISLLDNRTKLQFLLYVFCRCKSDSRESTWFSGIHGHIDNPGQCSDLQRESGTQTVRGKEGIALGGERVEMLVVISDHCFLSSFWDSAVVCGVESLFRSTSVRL